MLFNHFLVTSPECFDHVEVSNCGVSANTAMDEDHLPQNVLNAADTAWSPAIRLGAGWNDYLQFDFRKNTRITKVKIILKSESRKPTMIAIQVSNSGVTWRTVTTQEFKSNGEFIIYPAQETRYAKVIFKKYEEDETSQIPAGIRQVTWLGCFVPKYAISLECGGEDDTIISTDVSRYRHVAYDVFNEILYFCDVKLGSNKLACYGNIAGTRKFMELSPSVSSIVGYSAARGRMFFFDVNGNLISTNDGVSLTNNIGMKPEDITDLEVASVIPGFGADMDTITVEDYTVDFFGIMYKGDKIVSWGPCCKK